MAQAGTFVLPAQGDIVGQIEYVNPQIGETLSEVGIRHDVGYYEMMNANPGVDPTRPLSPQTRLIIPGQYILPSGPRSGLVINLAEYRLYYFPPNDNVVITMPVGIGREGWNTPVGQTKVTSKEHDPIWRPTANVRAEAAKNGTPIPNEFPPGAGNPLGRHVFRLGWPTYLIHGTNRRDGVGSRVSAGCIRMLPEDIETLFDMVSVGTTVRVINEPVKVGRYNNSIYVEAHTPLEQTISLSALLNTQLGKYSSSWNKTVVQEEGSRPSGIPRKVAG
ncbi:putative ErfK/YbiS/YcfS/YnhG family protein precursor [Legionella birminghamensis]|uniref:ErfK/YbiS/YcfS/YnhG family protein n=2 Tax=Legionella birminghamensis TaxID=28083 RepID=A0A378IB39_9GAMM|nr:putative ErfK/YbiS/YcfS/YnhG family protein precursor [Legionella birminghamensis]STX31985.1 putative ErfK/YbiS/YcfS/YnhG family protein precursor [Legionella birminghamensis]